ncbi:S8 family peptidase [Lentibacillus sediminis]|uniref:S8 family peptidase n=1 Tax=Lentibacillus sediminis TaxID=1940529 RepID=UPI000C1C5940|nr:S8 family peptidase [Lentibacillus sediminis]
MSSRKRVWYEEAGRKLDQGLREQLHHRRKQDPYETSEESIPVIVYFAEGTEKNKMDDVQAICRKEANNKIDSAIGIRNNVSGHLTPKMIRNIKDHEAVDRIYYDRPVSAFLDIATRHIGANNVQEQLGFTGKNVGIAVIDTGIYPHADLTEQANRIVAFKDFINDNEEAYDDNGHGTHCAGDAAGDGYQAEGEYAGPAPEASLIGVKALDQNGGGRLSTIIQGITWCIEHKEDYNIRIISLSLGAPAYESYRDDPLSQAVQEAWHQGIVVCAAAGNDGPAAMTISTPAINPFIITVGSAVDQNTEERSDDEIAEYSSRGPTIDSLVKPDIYAPGTDIISLLAPGSALETQLPEQIIDEHYIQLSGTSMATPICAGVVALMLEANPALSPNDVKSILQTTAPAMFDDQWGYVDANEAVMMARDYYRYEQVVR